MVHARDTQWPPDVHQTTAIAPTPGSALRRCTSASSCLAAGKKLVSAGSSAHQRPCRQVIVVLGEISHGPVSGLGGNRWFRGGPGVRTVGVPHEGEGDRRGPNAFRFAATHSARGDKTHVREQCGARSHVRGRSVQGFPTLIHGHRVPVVQQTNHSRPGHAPRRPPLSADGRTCDARDRRHQGNESRVPGLSGPR
jgi:hypothetical protein